VVRGLSFVDIECIIEERTQCCLLLADISLIRSDSLARLFYFHLKFVTQKHTPLVDRQTVPKGLSPKERYLISSPSRLLTLV